jgi:hypothetical protein
MGWHKKEKRRGFQAPEEEEMGFFIYLAAMPHMPLKPRMMFRAEPAMKAPCVALIACTNLCTWVGWNKPPLLFFRGKKRRMQIGRDVGKKGKEERRKGKKKKKQGHPPTSCGSSMSTMRGALTIDKVIGRK